MSERPRVLRPNRAQLELRPTDLESLLPEDHRARAVWDFVSGLDLSPWYEEIRAIEGEAGRPAIDPAILLSLWIYATLEGVGSARAVGRRHRSSGHDVSFRKEPHPCFRVGGRLVL